MKRGIPGRHAEDRAQDFGREARSAHAKQHDIGNAVALHGVSKRVQADDSSAIRAGELSQPRRLAIFCCVGGVGAPHRRVAAPERLGGGLSGARIGLGRVNERAREEAKRASKARALVGNLESRPHRDEIVRAAHFPSILSSGGNPPSA